MTARAGALRLTRARIINVRGLTDRTIDFGPVTRIEGENGSGKSSVFAALRSTLGLERTSLMRMVRLVDQEPAGAPTVEVTLHGFAADGSELEATITRKGDSSPVVKFRQGDTWLKVPKPAEWLRDLIDPSSNPERWLALDAEDQADEVLATMPLANYSRAAAMAQAGLADFHLPALPEGLHPLEELELIEKAVFDSRTQVNSLRQRARDAATKLLEGLPAEAPGGVAAELEEVQARELKLAAEVAATEAQIDITEREKLQSVGFVRDAKRGELLATADRDAANITADYNARVTEIRAECERRIAEQMSQMRTEADDIKTKLDLAMTAANSEHETAAAIIRAEASKGRDDLAAARAELSEAGQYLATLRERATSVERDRAVRETAKESEADAEKHAARAEHLTAGLKGLTRYKLELAERLPIRGLAVRFDEKGRKSLWLDGVPLDQVNKARRTELAVEVTLLRSAPPEDGRPHLSLVLLDDAEKLDPEARKALELEVAARGAQLVSAIVGGGAFKVDAHEAVTA